MLCFHTYITPPVSHHSFSLLLPLAHILSASIPPSVPINDLSFTLVSNLSISVLSGTLLGLINCWTQLEIVVSIWGCVHFSFRRKEEEEAVGAHYCAKMEDLLQQSDFVMLVVNLTPETHKLIGKKELGLMKPTATLINISRGRRIWNHCLWFHT